MSSYYHRRKAKIASASSLESFVGKTRSSATESIDEAKIDSAAASERVAYVQEAVLDILLDGRIFFSADASKAYDEFIEAAQDAKPIVLHLLDKASPSDELSRYKVLRKRQRELSTELEGRTKELEELEKALLAQDAENASKLY